MSPRDTPGDLQEDIEKIRRYRGQGIRDVGLAALVEGVFASLTGLVGIVWFASLYWVPDVIPSETWMAAGMVGLLVFGLPAGAIYMLRRGGAQVIERVIREVL